MSAPKKNKNAVKAAADKASSFLFVRTQPRNKAGWVKAAARAGERLTVWVTRVLNKEADK